MNDNVDQHGNVIPGLDEDGNPIDGNVGAGTTAPAVSPEPTPEPEEPAVGIGTTEAAPEPEPTPEPEDSDDSVGIGTTA